MKKRPVKDASKTGRPSIRSPQLGLKLCTLISEGLSLRAICKMEGMPSRTAVLEWLAADVEFAGQYARAREVQADFYLDEIIEIADASVGKAAAVVQAYRLRVDTRKWAMTKLAPKKYGEKLEHEHGVPGGLKLTHDVEAMPAAVAYARLVEIGKKGKR